MLILYVRHIGEWLSETFQTNLQSSGHIILLVYVIRFCYQLSSVTHGLLLQSWALWIITCLFSAANIPTERRESIKKCKESLIEYVMNCLLGNFEHSSECENDQLGSHSVSSNYEAAFLSLFENQPSSEWNWASKVSHSLLHPNSKL